jgi:hypothetical protein
MKRIGIQADEPRTFSIFNVVVDGGVIPILMVDDLGGHPHMVGEAVDFARSQMRRGLSLSRMRSAIYTIGLLHDYLTYCESEQVSPEDLPGIIQRFIVARLRGTIDRDGNDPTGLFWGKVRWAAVKRDRSQLRAYSDFCVRHYGYFPIVPGFPPLSLRQNSSLYQRINEEFRRRESELAKIKQSDLLGHLAHRRQVRPIFAVDLPGPRVVYRHHRRNQQHIPIEKIPELIMQTPSVVQRMIFILAAYGGPRPSEQLNLWIDDVLPGTFRKALFPDDEPSDWPLNRVYFGIRSFSTSGSSWVFSARRSARAMGFWLILSWKLATLVSSRSRLGWQCW